MRALWIVERFPPQKGGVAAAAGRQVSGLALHVDGIDVLQLTRDVAPGEVVAALDGRVTVHRVGQSRRDDESLRLLYQVGATIAARNPPTLIHGFYAGRAGYAAVALARRLGRPSVVSLRGNDVDLGMFHGSRLALLQATLSGADRLLGVSREILDTTRLVVGDRPGLRYLPNGVDVEAFAPGRASADPEIDGLPHPRIGFFGELRFKKGLSVLTTLAETLTEGTIAAVGGGRADEAGELARWRAREPSASGRLVELDYTRDPKRLASLYRGMDLVVFPSLWDGMPNALLEAMACGRPVLATAVGGIRDAIVHGESGLLVPVEQLGRFSDAVVDVLARAPAERDRIGAAARDRVVAEFTARRETESLLEVYRELSQEHP